MNHYDDYTNIFDTEPTPRPKRKIRINFFPSDKPILNAVLLVLTIASTWLTIGFWYSVAVILILGAHEMGHYLMCRKYCVPATLPFFIPFPLLNPFGTMGAVIKMKGFIPNRKALFDIGIAGPIGGLIFTIPALVIGLKLSTVIETTNQLTAGLILGESLLFKIISFITIGPVPENMDVALHPVAYAGWVGLFVTALNLLPIGQLDGGHIIYALLGPKSKYIYYAFIGFLAIVTIFYPGWALLLVILAILGRKHPAPLDNFVPIDKKRRLLGWFIFLIFFLSFTPKPFQF